MSTLDAALEYAAHGWAVFPLHGIVESHCTCGRLDCSSPGKHPLVSRGLHEATTDQRVINTWWRRWPHANVALATGERSGIVVVDIDLPGALPSLDKLVHKLPSTLTALTGGGGLHLVLSCTVPARDSIYRAETAAGSHLGCESDFDLGFTPHGDAARSGARDRSRAEEGSIYRAENTALRCTSARVPGIDGELPGIDVRANGGYVVAPPSLHASGERYRWLTTSNDVGDPHRRDESDHGEEDDESGPGLLGHGGTLTLIAPVPDWMREEPRRTRPIEVHPTRFTTGAGTERGLRLLAKQLAILRAASEGSRNHTLNRCAFIVACAAARGDLDEDAARSQLEQTALSIGLTNWETTRTISSAFTSVRCCLP